MSNESVMCIVYRVSLCALVLARMAEAGPDEDLRAAIRRADKGAMQTALSRGAHAASISPDGTPALMLAALQADAGSVRILLDRGADVNATDAGGSTALHWAIPDEAKVKLLLARGANVNAVSRSGSSPLLVAVGWPGTVHIVRMLLERGANLSLKDIRGRNVVIRAALSRDYDIMRLVLDRGVDVNSADEEGTTALMEAVMQADIGLADLLLARGADATHRNTEGGSALIPDGPLSDLSLYRKLVAHGADPSVQDAFGRTVLITAASSDTATPEVIRDLLAAGGDGRRKIASLHRKDGESALDWALKRGDTPQARLLAGDAGKPLKPPADPILPRLHPGSPRQALDHALPLLFAGGSSFVKKSGCVSCHHNSLPSLAFSLARQRGIVLDPQQLRSHTESALAIIRGSRNLLLDGIRFPGGATTAAYFALGIAADGHSSDLTTDALVQYLAGNQTSEGYWSARADRPPIEYGRIAPTALSIRALRTFPIPGRGAEFNARVQRAVQWLATVKPLTTEEKAFRLLGLVWADGDQDTVGKAAQQLASEQRIDGGWTQLPTLSSDAYATGQVLYALAQTGYLAPQASAYQKGVRFLLETQLEDGSWFVRSRSYPIQPQYFQTGFPHGVDQWISSAATSWACAALALALN